MRGSASQSMQSRYMQVLLLTKTESNYLQMHTMQKLGDATDGMWGELRKFYEGEMQAFDDLIAVLVMHDAVTPAVLVPAPGTEENDVPF